MDTQQALITLSKWAQAFSIPPAIIPSNLEQIEKLTELNLYLANNSATSKPVTRIPAEIAVLKNLRKLNLSYQELTSTPVELFQLKNLEELVLSSNKITTLPPEIKYLTKLKRLLVDNNNIATLPIEIGHLVDL